jgi:surface antigen
MIELNRRNGERFARIGRSGALTCLFALAAAALGGCSFSMSLPSFMQDDETGLIKPKRSPLSAELDSADWRVARPALAKALAGADSQPPVAWSNPDSGHGGLFQSVGLAFAREGRNCRAFVAGVNAGEAKSMLQGVGCEGDNGEVALESVGPWRGP